MASTRSPTFPQVTGVVPAQARRQTQPALDKLRDAVEPSPTASPTVLVEQWLTSTVAPGARSQDPPRSSPVPLRHLASP